MLADGRETKDETLLTILWHKRYQAVSGWSYKRAAVAKLLTDEKPMHCWCKCLFVLPLGMVGLNGKATLP